MPPVIALMLETFPFKIFGFHSDRGSEYINHDTAKLLNKLNVEFTRSRPRHTNDNALAECKNGTVARKIMGYRRIPQKHAAEINGVYRDALNRDLNLHRPCYFATDTADAEEKIKKIYPQNQIATPYKRLQFIHDFRTRLRLYIDPEGFSQLAIALSDNEATKQVQEAKRRLFQSFNRRPKIAA